MEERIILDNVRTSKVRKKTTRPGQHGATPKKLTQYALRLEEKQKLKFNYGVSEKQLINYIKNLYI